MAVEEAVEDAFQLFGEINDEEAMLPRANRATVNVRIFNEVSPQVDPAFKEPLLRLIESFPKKLTQIKRNRHYWPLLVGLVGKEKAIELYLRQVQVPEGQYYPVQLFVEQLVSHAVCRTPEEARSLVDNHVTKLYQPKPTKQPA